MKKIQYSLIFNRKGELNMHGKGLIQIRTYQDGKSRYFSTGIYIEPDYWDDRNKKVKHTHPNQFGYNQHINDQLLKIETFEIRMIKRHGRFPLERLHEYQNQKSKEEPTSFTEFIDKELKASRMKPGSRKMYAQTLNKLRAFKPRIYFEDISHTLVSDFDRFLFKQGLGVNTIMKHHHRLKSFILEAIRKDHLKVDDNPYIKFKPKSQEPERVFLTAEELEQIEQLEIPANVPHLEQIRDTFLLATYTGLRFGDVTSLTPAHFSRTSKGLALSIKAEKTGKTITLPLYHLFRKEGQPKSRPEALVERYLSKFEPHSELDQERIFRITNQYFNRKLKSLAKLAGIRKKLTAHVSRRTFATIMATKVKAPVLQRLLQHSRPDMTNIYIQLSDELIEKELDQIEWK